MPAPSTLREHRGHALAFLDRARQVAGRVDDEQHVELARAAALLAPFGDRHALPRHSGGERPIAPAGAQPPSDSASQGQCALAVSCTTTSGADLTEGSASAISGGSRSSARRSPNSARSRDGHAGHEPGMLAFEQAVVEPPAGDERGRLRRGAEQRDAQLSRPTPARTARPAASQSASAARAGLRAGLRSRASLSSGAAGCRRSRSSATLPRLGDACRVARNDRDALEALVGLEVGERRQHALELRARRVRGPGARGRAPEHHGEVVDARERERARHVRRGEALHVGAVAAEVAESREHDELRHESAAADRQHEHFAGGGADRAPPREVADRAVQHPVDRPGRRRPARRSRRRRARARRRCSA